jgi:hypothetical protein
MQGNQNFTRFLVCVDDAELMEKLAKSRNGTIDQMGDYSLGINLKPAMFSEEVDINDRRCSKTENHRHFM